MGQAEIQAITLSLEVAACSMLVGVPAAVGVAFLLARCRFPGRALLDALVHLPLVVPPVVVGYLLLIVLGRRGIVGSWLYQELGIVFAFRWTGAVIAAAVMSFPLI